jgi:hypothetical protein
MVFLGLPFKTIMGSTLETSTQILEIIKVICSHKRKQFLMKYMVVHICNPSTWETEAGVSPGPL